MVSLGLATLVYSYNLLCCHSGNLDSPWPQDLGPFRPRAYFDNSGLGYGIQLNSLGLGTGCIRAHRFRASAF
jgi:hypothetical protein